MVDPGPTIHGINASTTMLGYMGMSSSSTFASATAQISTVSTNTTFVGGIGPYGGSGGGGSGSSPPPPPLPSNPVLNTILQNMGQLELELTILASSSGQSFVSTYYRKSPFDITILNTILPTVAKSLKFDRFNGDGDLNVHIDSFMTMCSDYHSLNFVLLKLFLCSLKGTTLEWYSSLPDYSIHNFDQLIDLFLKPFQANIGSKVTIGDIVHCKQKPNEKITDFISRYQAISTKISFSLPDDDLQRMFIDNLQSALRENLSLN
ncbi:uncharacterized protein LOC131858289 [Cryptomeria japonica]|uniref:uncharacterized protein LOC131858289 n=1 Tax=Cryptomeria japonica TaxID=3369 RepID=UPI0027DA4C8F|nr:uncharacterized protein LOC131858289 [Cryptomeria japonica]